MIFRLLPVGFTILWKAPNKFKGTGLQHTVHLPVGVPTVQEATLNGKAQTARQPKISTGTHHFTGGQNEVTCTGCSTPIHYQ